MCFNHILKTSMRKPDNSNCNANFVSCGLKLLWPWCSGHSVRVATQGTTQPNSSIWDDLRSLALVLLLLLLLADGFHKPIHSTVPPNSPWLLSRTLITPLFPFTLVVRSSSPLPPQITELDHPFALLGVLPSRLRFYSTSWLFQSLLGQFPRGWLAFSIPPPLSLFLLFSFSFSSSSSSTSTAIFSIPSYTVILLLSSIIPQWTLTGVYDAAAILLVAHNLLLS